MFIEKDTLHSSIRTLWINGNALECPSQCLIHNPTEMLWKDLKQEVYRRKPMNITSGFVLRKGLISRADQLYLQLLLQNGVTPDTESKDSHSFAKYVNLVWKSDDVLGHI